MTSLYIKPHESVDYQLPSFPRLRSEVDWIQSDYQPLTQYASLESVGNRSREKSYIVRFDPQKFSHDRYYCYTSSHKVGCADLVMEVAIQTLFKVFPSILRHEVLLHNKIHVCSLYSFPKSFLDRFLCVSRSYPDAKILETPSIIRDSIIHVGESSYELPIQIIPQSRYTIVFAQEIATKQTLSHDFYDRESARIKEALAFLQKRLSPDCLD